MGYLTVEHRRNFSGALTEPGISPNIWSNCPWGLIDDGVIPGRIFWDDFLNFPQHSSSQTTQLYSSFISTGVTIKATAQKYGEVEFAALDAADEEALITTGGNTGTLAIISDTAADARQLWFECRIKKSSVADNALAIFVGLAEEGLAAADTLVDTTGALADKDFFGFRVMHDNGEELDVAWSKAGDGVATQEIANIATLAADTYVKLGFIYDPLANPDKRIRIFVNNVEYVTAVTAAQIALGSFPDGEELALLLAAKSGGATEKKLQIDWWRLAQLG